jgi:membrane associated rhomboid family serine protease
MLAMSAIALGVALDAEDETEQAEKKEEESVDPSAPRMHSVFEQWKRQLSSAQLTIYPIIALNSLVFLVSALQIPMASSSKYGHMSEKLNEHFHKHWKCSPENIIHRRLHTVVTSGFNHGGAFHLAINMYILYQFGRQVHRDLGRERFLTLYGAGIVAGSVGSLAWKFAVRDPTPSVGASAGVYALVSAFATYHPDARMGIIFLPFSFPAEPFLYCAMAGEVVGMVTRMTRIDHAGHLGGAIAGLGLARYWRSVDKQQQLRGGGRGGDAHSKRVIIR